MTDYVVLVHIDGTLALHTLTLMLSLSHQAK